MKVVPQIVLLFASFIVYCQTSKSTIGTQLDSLKSELKLARNDSLKASILLQLSSNYVKTNPDSAIHYGEKAFEVAKNIGNNRIAIRVLGFVGDAYQSKGNLPKGLEVCLQAVALSKELSGSDEYSVAVAYSTLGNIHTDVGNYRQAFSYYSTLLVLHLSSDLKSLIDAFGHMGRAGVYEKMNMLDSALYELEASKKGFSEIPVGTHNLYPKIYPVMPKWFNLRSRVYIKQGKIDLALQDLNTTLNMTLKNDQPYYSSNSYNDIASLYANLNARDSAIYFAKKGLQEANRISYTGGILTASEILAGQFDSVNDTEALNYLKLANRMRNQLYGASNIQLMKDMIAQNEKRQQELATTEAAYQNKLKVNGLLGLALVLILTTIFLIRNNRNKQKAKRIIESAYDQLKSTQSQLIQSEKMASLGELTAGIAHEIQNPLNFVNNFSEINTELIDELKKELAVGSKQSAEELADDIKENEQKINHHGKRAGDIVKGMLQHSRVSSGQKELTDINALCDEYLRLSYHGLRAKDKSFNAKFESDFDSSLPKVNIVPQDIGRVVLNLINNAFYAVTEKSKQNIPGYEPTVVVSTHYSLSSGKGRPVPGSSGGEAIISVKDNGNGIPDSIKEKIFQPFFTTKPTGQGTGLGLSLSYDIVKTHGGEIIVETEEGKGSEFIIQIHANS